MMRHADVAVSEIILSDEHGDYTRAATRGRRVDRHNAGVGVRRAHERGIALIRQREVVGVIAAPAHEPQILEPRHGAPDEGTGASRKVGQHCTIARCSTPSIPDRAYPSLRGVANRPPRPFVVHRTLLAIINRAATLIDATPR